MTSRCVRGVAAALSVLAALGLGAAPAEAQELDRDGDGVVDTVDGCPDAAATSVFGGNGCPATPQDVAPSQPPPVHPVFIRPQGAEADRPGPAMRNVGIALTIASVVVGIAGTAVAAHLAEQGHDELFMGAAVGVGTAVIGGSMHLTGVTLWVVGALRYDGPSDSRDVGLRPTPGSVKGASVRASF